MATKKTAAKKTAAAPPQKDPIDRPDAPPPAPPPSPVAVYAKAVVAFLVSAATLVGTWSATALADDTITRLEWVTLGVAIVGTLGTTYGVAATENADPKAAGAADAGVSQTGVALAIVVLIAAVLLGLAASKLFWLLVIVALLMLLL